MGIKSYKPQTPARRFYDVSDFAEVTKEKPVKSLTVALKNSAGRNHFGRVTVTKRGGGHKRRFRIIDFLRRDKDGIPGTVHSIEYDPNRSARIALLHYSDGEKRYILAPLELKVGDAVMSGPDAEIKAGNAMPLKSMPLGTMVHNVEMKIGKGGQMIRSAGTAGQIMARDENYVQIKMPSGEIRKVFKTHMIAYI